MSSLLRTVLNERMKNVNLLRTGADIIENVRKISPPKNITSQSNINCFLLNVMTYSNSTEQRTICNSFYSCEQSTVFYECAKLK